MAAVAAAVAVTAAAAGSDGRKEGTDPMGQGWAVGERKEEGTNPKVSPGCSSGKFFIWLNC